MEFIISELKENEFFVKDIISELRDALSPYEGFCFLRHPLLEANNSSGIPSFLVVSPIFGSVVLDVYRFDIDKIERLKDSTWYFTDWNFDGREVLEEAEDKLSLVSGKVTTDRKLRRFSKEDNRLKGRCFIYLSNISEGQWENRFEDTYRENIIFQSKLKTFWDAQPGRFTNRIPDDIWNTFMGILTGISVLRKPTRRTESERTKAGIIRKVEEQIQSLDLEQMKVAQQISPGPQRIRGLAGTGKTIVLAMKAAYMHVEHPEWNIVYTFNTQSLYDYIHDLIRRFYQYWGNGHEPSWEKLRILHGWGGRRREGLYSYVSQLAHIRPKTYAEAKDFYQHKQRIELLGKSCLDLIAKGLPQLFDAILIDEAQDFHRGFFQFCLKILNSPKRLIWAYDELQSLEDVTIPTATEIFGLDEDGKAMVDLDGVYEGGIEKDFVLHKAYRNPRIILMTAHILGMGLLREKGAIQFIPKEGAWEDLGYKVVNGNFAIGNRIRISRLPENSPNIIETLTNPKSLLRTKTFGSKNEELKWIAEQVHQDTSGEKLTPEDILIIGFNHDDLFDQFAALKTFLAQKGINSFVIGKDVRRDTFRVPNMVTLSTVFKAKGNESPAVYIFNFENSEIQEKIIQSRNMAFASITRAKAWCTITGVGSTMVKMEREIGRILSQYPYATFEVPDVSKIKRYLDNIEYEKRRSRIKKSEKELKKAVQRIIQLKGERELSEETLRQLAKIVEKSKEGRSK